MRGNSKSAIRPKLLKVDDMDNEETVLIELLVNQTEVKKILKDIELLTLLDIDNKSLKATRDLLLTISSASDVEVVKKRREDQIKADEYQTAQLQMEQQIQFEKLKLDFDTKVYSTQMVETTTKPTKKERKLNTWLKSISVKPPF